ncbi:MAG TPA: Stp1/IreP family PP2C-type Ser/Thr phosphatase [Terriglobales bacterium]|nr:Stp1/IreP family PP2C-type Ser/Thr phosphatase [Terriglobales bacterium]
MLIREGIELASLTDVGCQRENNEDAYAYWESAHDDEFARKGRLLIVADGMGGHQGGQEASHLAVQVVQDIYATEDGTPQILLNTGIHTAHQRIQACAEQNSALHGMGTTCTAVALVGNQVYFAHVGDSRLYLVRGSVITQLTRDHSYVGRLIQSGVISPQDAESHPQRHVLTAALGAGSPEVSPDVPEHPFLLQKDDVLLLCTDGLWGLVPERDMVVTVNSNSPSAACRALVQMAKDRGGPDNITLQILKF